MLKPDYYVQKETTEHGVDGFVVRDKGNEYQASFAYRHDAELFVTIMNCVECKGVVEAHTRVTKSRTVK